MTKLTDRLQLIESIITDIKASFYTDEASYGAEDEEYEDSHACAYDSAAADSLSHAGFTVADIGTDHGYLPLSLYEKGICDHVIFTDVSRGSLDKARQNCEMSHPGMDFDLRLGDGIKVLRPGEADIIVMAGMGGLLMADILGSSPEVTGAAGFIIMQPRSAKGELRHWLLSSGYTITGEHLVRERKDVCSVIIAVPPQRASLFRGKDQGNDQVKDILPESDQLQSAGIQPESDQLQSAGNQPDTDLSHGAIILHDMDAALRPDEEQTIDSPQRGTLRSQEKIPCLQEKTIHYIAGNLEDILNIRSTSIRLEAPVWLKNCDRTLLEEYVTDLIRREKVVLDHLQYSEDPEEKEERTKEVNENISYLRSLVEDPV